MFVELVGSAELLDSEGSGDVGQVALVTGGDYLVFPGAREGVPVPGFVTEAVETDYSNPFGEILVGGGQHAALTRSDGLVGVERETGGIADAADQLSSVAGG